MIALDAMGGDFAPHATLEGALSAAKSGVEVILFGPEEKMRLFLASKDSAWESYPIKLKNSPQTIEMGEDPISAIKGKKNSSLVEAVSALKSGVVNAVVSAGNSGALMAASVLLLGKNEGMERPAIAGFIPVKNGHVLCLDLGANTECKPANLLQFAKMGASYLKNKCRIINPKVGLLSNGSEDSKGSLLTKEAFSLLKNAEINFVGNVEPEDILEHKVDLVVTDGFTGNVFLKTVEAFSKNGSEWMNVGGALLMGVNGTVVVSHGKSNAKAIENAILLASKNKI